MINKEWLCVLALVVNCLKTQPDWMEKLPDTVKSLELNKLFLPGTHNSGAYDKRVIQNPSIYFEKYIYNQVSSIVVMMHLVKTY